MVGGLLYEYYLEFGSDVWYCEDDFCWLMFDSGVGEFSSLCWGFFDRLKRSCFRDFFLVFDGAFCRWVPDYEGSPWRIKISEILFYVWDPVFLWCRDEDPFSRQVSRVLYLGVCDVRLGGFKKYCDDYFSFIEEKRDIFTEWGGVTRFVFNVFEDAVFEALQSGFGQSEVEDCLFDWAMTHFGPEVMPSIFLDTAAEHEEQLRFRSALASQKIMEVVRSAC